MDTIQVLCWLVGIVIFFATIFIQRKWHHYGELRIVQFADGSFCVQTWDDDYGTNMLCQWRKLETFKTLASARKFANRMHMSNTNKKLSSIVVKVYPIIDESDDTNVQ